MTLRRCALPLLLVAMFSVVLFIVWGTPPAVAQTPQPSSPNPLSTDLLSANPLPSASQAPSDGYYKDYNVELLSHYTVTTSVYDFAVQSGYVYVSAADGLHIIDFKNPKAPTEIARLDLSSQGEFTGIALNENNAYLAETSIWTQKEWVGDNVLHIIDVSDPIAPKVVHTVELPGSVSRIIVQGNYAYAVGFRLYIYDLNDPLNPIHIGTYMNDWGVEDVVVAGDYAYVATRHPGLKVVDITNPSYPREVGSFPINDAFDVAVSGNYVYVSQGDDGWGYQGGLHILDVSDPAVPKSVYFHYGNVGPLAISGEHLFTGNIRVYNITNPESTTEVGYYSVGAITLASEANYIYALDYQGSISILHYTGAGEPFLAGRLLDASGEPIPNAVISDSLGHTTRTDTYGRYGILGVVSGTHTITATKSAYTFSPSSRTVTVPPNGTSQNFTGNLAKVDLVALSQWGGPTNAVAVQGRYAYLGVGHRLQIFDVSNPDNPILVGQSAVLPREIRDVAVSGNYAYIAQPGVFDQFGHDGWQGGGIRVLDVSNRASPKFVAFVDTRHAREVVISGNYAYVVGGGWDNDGLLLYTLDISDPAKLASSQGVYGTFQANSISVTGKYLFTTYHKPYDETIKGLRILDITNPAEPQMVSEYQMSNNPYAVTASNGYAYVAETSSTSGVRIFDVNNPAAPQEVGFLPHSARTLLALNDVLYLAQNGGLRAFDITDPSVPEALGFYVTPDVVSRDVAVINDSAYLAAQGLHIVNVAEPSNLNPRATYHTPGDTTDVEVVDGVAYLAAQGLHIVDVRNPSTPYEIGYLSGPASTLSVVDDHAYIAHSRGLRVVNVADSSRPVQVGTFALDTVADYQEVVVIGNRAYFAFVSYNYSEQDVGGLHILDISNPAAPTRLGFFPHLAGEVAIIDNYAYLPGGNDMIVVDVSDPAHPKQVNVIPDVDGGHFVVAGQLAYVVGYDVEVLDVSNPATPIEIGSAPPSGIDIAIADNKAYVAGGKGGLHTLDVSFPPAPSEINFYDIQGSAVAVTTHNDNIYVASGYGGLVILHRSTNLYLPLLHR